MRRHHAASGMYLRIAILSSLLAAAFVACSDDRQTSTGRPQGPMPQADSVDRVAAQAAIAVTDSFLRQYVETASPRTPTVVKYWTGDCAQAEASPSLWVATYHVLSVERRQDTLIVAAQ